MQNLDLDKLERNAAMVKTIQGGIASIEPDVILALIARLRAAEAQLKEYRELESGQ